jgi:pimeloyl-[acyl-carrier protein] synthase
MLLRLGLEMPEYDLFSADFYASPEATFDDMRLNHPVYWCDRLESWVLTRYQDISSTIRDPNFSVDRKGQIGQGGSAATKAQLAFCNSVFASWMVFSDPPNHTFLRGIGSQVFTPKMMASYQPCIEDFTFELIQNLKTQSQIELIQDFGMPLPALVTAAMFGLPRSDIAKFKEWSSSMFTLFGAGNASDAVINAAHQNLVDCIQYFQDRVKADLSAPGESLMKQLAHATEAGRQLTLEEIATMCIVMMVGAYETTTYLIANGILALLQNPLELAKLKADPGLIDSAVEELFRYCGPAFSTVRRAKNDTQINGQAIQAGDKVYCLLVAGNHDPDRFDQPRQLNLARQDNRHLGLGLGIHVCLGAALTRLETKIAINALIQHFPDMSVNSTKLEWIPNLSTRGLKELPIVLAE